MLRFIYENKLKWSLKAFLKKKDYRFRTDLLENTFL